MILSEHSKLTGQSRGRRQCGNSQLEKRKNYHPALNPPTLSRSEHGKGWSMKRYNCLAKLFFFISFSSFFSLLLFLFLLLLLLFLLFLLFLFMFLFCCSSSSFSSSSSPSDCLIPTLLKHQTI